MDYIYTAKKSGGKWKILIAFTDIYNYEMWGWRKYGNSAMVAVINNYGVAAQSLGAIVPFNVTVNMPYVYY